MISAIKSEFRKLLSVRSTYVLMFLCLAIMALVAFYLQGYKAGDSAALNPNLLTASVTSTIQSASLFISLAGILLVTHEYRYNTILYSLTAARKRWMVPAAKIIVVSVFAVAVTLVLSALAPLMTKLGLQMAGLDLAPQDFAFAETIGKALFYAWGSSMLAVIIALLVRSQVGAIVTILLFPGLAENLLGLLLQEDSKYLPFRALEQFLSASASTAGTSAVLTTSQAALVALGYIVVTGAASFVLFQKRDAN